MSQRITRITLFKIPGDEDQKRVIDFYRGMPQKALKDGKPYILSVTAGRAQADQRAQGFTIAAISVFESAEDMAFYDNECAAHAELKGYAKGVNQGFAMVYFKSEV